MVVETDVASHLWVRLSKQPPWIHKKPRLIRGVPFVEDVRFCFTAFHDNEQFEPGDTFIHTFWKENWPVCTTKWLYVWGKINGQVCLSTSPIFKYHNDGIGPVPPPDAMYQLNSIDPEFHSLGQGAVFFNEPCDHDIPVGATGVILALNHKDIGSETRIAFRKPGANYDNFFPFMRGGVTWVIVGVDDDRTFEYRAQRVGSFDGYVMGYTGRNVVFPDEPIDIKPAVNGVYSEFDIKAVWPEAILIFTDMGSNDSWGNYHSIRPSGSVKEIYQGSWRKWPFCAVPDNGKIETKLNKVGDPSTEWKAYGYIKEDATYSLDGEDLGAIGAGVWTKKDAGVLSLETRWAFVEWLMLATAPTHSIRKDGSYFNQIGKNTVHNWMITHVDEAQEFEIYNSAGAPSAYLLAETH